jgi:toxin YoeB
MIYKIEFRKEAIIQLSELRKGDKNTYIKCFDILLAIAVNPREGIGKPERLKGYEDFEVFSRRVNDKDRLIYEIIETEQLVEIISCVGHYDDH